MVILEVEAKEQNFPYKGYTIELRYNDYFGYWFYNIISDEKSQYGVSLRTGEIASRGLLYRGLPILGVIDSNPTSLYPIDTKKDLGDRLKLVLVDKEEYDG
jgi:hypothetical protein